MLAIITSLANLLLTKCIGILAPLAAAAIIVPKAIRHKNALRV